MNKSFIAALGMAVALGLSVPMLTASTANAANAASTTSTTPMTHQKKHHATKTKKHTNNTSQKAAPKY